MISAGDRLDGKYVVDRRLGSGGFGDVYLATDEAIPSRQVAIKVLGGVEEGNHENLIWEMQALARMNHPGVVAFYHHFTDDDRLFLVMEFCDGGSLHDRIYSPGELGEEQVVECGMGKAEGGRRGTVKGILLRAARYGDASICRPTVN